jgi:hypothetical protein
LLLFASELVFGNGFFRSLMLYRGSDVIGASFLCFALFVDLSVSVDGTGRFLELDADMSGDG